MGPTMAGRREGTIPCSVNRNNKAACLPHGGLSVAYKFPDLFLLLPSLILAFSLSPQATHTLVLTLRSSCLPTMTLSSFVLS